MPLYEVLLNVRATMVIEVDAANEVEAQEIASGQTDDLDDSMVYSVDVDGCRQVGE